MICSTIAKYDYLHQKSIMVLWLYKEISLTKDEILNAIYSCVTHLVNPEMLDEEEQILPVTSKIHPRHFPKLFKLVDLYFRVQHIKMLRYFLVQNTLLYQMINTVFAFVDGSKQFAISMIYLLSYDNNSSNYRVSLISTICKLNANAQASEIWLNYRTQ